MRVSPCGTFQPAVLPGRLKAKEAAYTLLVTLTRLAVESTPWRVTQPESWSALRIVWRVPSTRP